MSRAASVRWLRVALIAGVVLALEALCRAGLVSRHTLIAPSEMALSLARLLASGRVAGDIRFTLQNTAAAIAASIVAGFAIGAAVHALPRLRRALDPLFSAYYAVPTFVLYPLLIVAFGIGATSLIAMGAMFGVVAMIINTLIGLDRVPLALMKTARVMRLGGARTMLLVRLPAALPTLVTGMKLAVAYSVIGVVAAEFILATAGVGKRIAFAYNDFDTRTMYALMLLIIVAVMVLNGMLHAWEQRLHRRWGRA
ncbi:MAG TPA: ABC transporter permease subunit [Burkholderiales bacterium]